MAAGINKIAAGLAALTILGVTMPVVAQADDWHDRRDRVVVVRNDWDRRREERVVVQPACPVAYVAPRVECVVPAPVVYVAPRVAYVVPRESLQDRKNDARNVATVGLAATAVGLLTHNNGLTAVGAIGAISGGAQYERDRTLQNQRW